MDTDYTRLVPAQENRPQSLRRPGLLRRLPSGSATGLQKLIVIIVIIEVKRLFIEI